MAFAIKAGIDDPRAKTFAFTAQKTMYGGKHIAKGDVIFPVRERERRRSRPDRARRGHSGRGPADPASPVRRAGEHHGRARGAGEAAELKPFADWNDGQPETELNFKFYRQATDKIVGLSPGAAALLATFF